MLIEKVKKGVGENVVGKRVVVGEYVEVGKNVEVGKGVGGWVMPMTISVGLSLSGGLV